MRVAVFHNAVSPDASVADQDVLVQVEEVRRALVDLGHEPVPVAVTLDLEPARRRLAAIRPDVVFNLVETLAGSDWLMLAATALLDTLGVPYTGAPTEALLLTTHKLLAKQRLLAAEIPTPAWIEGGGRRQGLDPAGEAADDWIVKAVREHASFGLDEDSVVYAQTASQVGARLAGETARLGRACFAERYIDGREFNLSVLAGPEGPQVLPPAEIDFADYPAGKPRVVGHRAKWEQGSFEFDHTPPRFDFPPSDAPLLERLRQIALRCWHAFGLRGYGRIDFRVDRHDRPWVLEINANCCLSPDAGFVAALDRASVGFPQAIARILDDARQVVACAGQTEPAGPVERSEPVGWVERGEPHRLEPQASESATHSEPHRAPHGITFRHELEPEDRDLVRAIVESTGFFNPAEVDVAVELVDERLAKGPASGYHFLLAQREGRTVGYTCYGPIAGTAASFDLYWIAVEDSLRRQGLGRFLLDQTERLIAQAGGRQVYVETSSRDQYRPTRTFYERSGYGLEALIEDFYAPGDHKVIYVKRLAG